MAKYQLLITDITNYGEQRCVAGWDLDRGKMIRPEPAPAGFWEGNYLGADGVFDRGVIVKFEADHPDPPTQYPHRTEDRVVAGSIERVKTLSAAERRTILAKTPSKDLVALFEGNMKTDNLKGYIPEGTKCRSLGSVEMDTVNFILTEDEFKGRKSLRCRLKFGNFFITPTIPSNLVQSTYRQGGLNAVQAKLKGVERLHLRIGLARAFAAKPDRCYVQVNDVYLIR